MLKVILAAACFFGADAAVHYSAPINDFTLNLLQNVYAFQENFGAQNIALSPISAWNIFALLTEGAAGATFDELIQVLRLPKDLRDTQILHSAAHETLKKSNEDVLLKKQTAIFAEMSLRFHRDFCDSAAMYNTDVYTVDTSNTTRLAQDINFYICLATDGRITNTVKADMLDNLRLLLVDAIYFKANWTNRFDNADTKTEPFYDQQGRGIGDVNMMYQKVPNKIVQSDQLEAEILELTYGKDQDFSMVFFVPDDGVPLKRVLDNLSKDNLSKWMESLRNFDQNTSVECRVPRFKVSTQIDLIQPLKYMGLYNIFDDEKAELPGISNSPLYVSKSLQKVSVEVSEEGTVAAAATVVGLENRILGPSITVNKPFVFLIMNRRQSVILFAGVYTNPSVI